MPFQYIAIYMELVAEDEHIVRRVSGHVSSPRCSDLPGLSCRLYPHVSVNVIRIPNSMSMSGLTAVVGHMVNLFNVQLTKFLHLSEPMDPAKPWGPSTHIPVLFVWSSLHPQVFFSFIVSLTALVQAINGNTVRRSGHLRLYRQPDYGHVRRISLSDVPEDWKCTKASCNSHRVENEPLRTLCLSLDRISLCPKASH
ncbi:uncharacterized protein BO96DRAFT_9033 [Aspergillus niger CBS 101883]|uniref:uncharacterized protein n=1 Tax=Aspergillus lacticoffeatus (strain CBS 101883) TaxID=1450533 RepID=UPI000D8023B7|nr:uncharacterized protein BO96DRAFT_9033 [Aspergillus niger CBS 101883]PYH62186.1 hypothetical protein BO96DRAFT_9033 [Aspergillus niger CBS 101883]